jgi:hypothetical protein
VRRIILIWVCSVILGIAYAQSSIVIGNVPSERVILTENNIADVVEIGQLQILQSVINPITNTNYANNCITLQQDATYILQLNEHLEMRRLSEADSPLLYNCPSLCDQPDRYEYIIASEPNTLPRGNVLEIHDLQGESEPVRLIHAPSDRTSYRIFDFAASSDGNTIATIAMAHIDSQVVVSVWDVPTRERQIIWSSKFLSSTTYSLFHRGAGDVAVPSIYLKPDASEVAVRLSYYEPPQYPYEATRVLRRWSLSTGEELPSIENPPFFINYADDYMIDVQAVGEHMIRPRVVRISDGAELLQVDTVHSMIPPYVHFSLAIPKVLQMSQRYVIFADETTDENDVLIVDLMAQTQYRLTTEAIGYDRFYFSDDLTIAYMIRMTDVLVWDVDGEDSAPDRVYEMPYVPTVVAIAPDGSLIVRTVDAQDYATVYESRLFRRTLTDNRLEPILTLSGRRADVVTFSPDDALMVIGDHRGRLDIYDAVTMEILATYEFGNATIVGVIAASFSNDGKLLAVVAPRSIYIIDMDALEIINRLSHSRLSLGGTDIGMLPIFSADGRWLAYAGSHVWRVENQGKLIALTNFEDIDDVAFQQMAQQNIRWTDYRRDLYLTGNQYRSNWTVFSTNNGALFLSSDTMDSFHIGVDFILLNNTFVFGLEAD